MCIPHTQRDVFRSDGPDHSIHRLKKGNEYFHLAVQPFSAEIPGFWFSPYLLDLSLCSRERASTGCTDFMIRRESSMKPEAKVRWTGPSAETWRAIQIETREAGKHWRNQARMAAVIIDISEIVINLI